MALAAGTKHRPYEIMASPGAGGMGEVYRARDSRLEREVAIKVVPSHLSENSDLCASFERKAKLISDRQHPHVYVPQGGSLGRQRQRSVRLEFRPFAN